MSDIKEFKCPACGAPMEFDSASQKMKCPYCLTELDINEFQDQQQEQQQQEQQQQGTQDTYDDSEWRSMSGDTWDESETAGMHVYSCNSCGGEIIADDTTGATTCPFCGNKVVMKGQFAGDLKPDYIIPFKLDKKAAKAAYLNHLKGKAFLPKVFKDENHIDEIKGVYVPFWLFDADTRGQVLYDAEKSRTWRSGNTEYTETEYYKISRGGEIKFNKVPADCSTKMDDTLMESIEPYDFKDAVRFQSAYLAGYLADRYDVKKEERIGRVRERMTKSTEEAFRSTVTGYTSVRPSTSNIQVCNAQYSYVLYPVWILNTTWNNQKFVFAMNGQTGKLVGDLPADKKAFWKYAITRGAVIGAAIYAVMWLIALL